MPATQQHCPDLPWSTLPILLLLLLLQGGTPPAAEPFKPVLISSGFFDPCGGVCTDPWVLIDTTTKKLTVFQGRREALVFTYFAAGVSGPGIKRARGDDVTPLGLYHVTAVRPSKKFSIFIELDYPSIRDGQRAFTEQRLANSTLQRIVNAHVRDQLPPQDTVLGGNIGIHGIGKGDPEIHRFANWTAGCIALENSQIEQLAKLLRRGVVVRIQ